MGLDTVVLDYIQGRRSSKFVLGLLRCMSLLYGTGVRLRNVFYDKGWAYVEHLPASVISVGNIVAGGTGKTPFVGFLARSLKSRPVAILSRGYRSKIEASGGVSRISLETTAALCGDEPFWLASQFPTMAVWVGKDRVKAGKRALQEGAKILILDDGLQYRRLGRNIEIILLDALDLFGGGHFLPRGLLRDSPSRLAKADLIVLNHVQDLSQYEILKSALKALTTAPSIAMRYVPKVSYQGKRVGVFCGIAKPDRFLTTVKQSGADIAASLFLGDHEGISEEHLKAFAKACKKEGADCLLCTEKDRVKLKTDIHAELPIFSLEAELEIVAGQKAWNELLQKVNL